MFNVFFRVLWRTAILFIGIGIAWFTAFIFFPYADAWLPAFLLILLFYVVFAYVVIPTLIRVLHLFDKPKHIPRYAITPDGWPSDPVNIAVVTSSREQLISSMQRAGWHVADESNMRNNLRALFAMVFNKPYPTAPFSTLYLFGRPFDVGFEKPSNPQNSPRSRHHVRFWRLELPEDDDHSIHFHFWHKRLKHLLGGKKEVWIGAAIEDTSLFGIRWRSGTITHQINVNTDAERDLIIADLSSAHQVRVVDVVPAGEPFSFRGQTLGRGGPLICDGTLTVVELRGRLKSATLSYLPKK